MAPAIDGDRVGRAIEAAERRTSAEIVVAMSPFFVGRVDRAARLAFARLGVAATHGRNGVLLFVVPRRRQVIVLADTEAEARVDPRTWERAAATVAAGFARGDASGGLVEAIADLGEALAGPFPPLPGDLDELPGFTGVAASPTP